jgi:hypothetical protein
MGHSFGDGLIVPAQDRDPYDRLQNDRRQQAMLGRLLHARLAERGFDAR